MALGIGDEMHSGQTDEQEDRIITCKLLTCYFIGKIYNIYNFSLNSHAENNWINVI